MGIRSKLAEYVSRWLAEEQEPDGVPLCNFERLCFEIRHSDVLLVEGRSRVSQVIKTITQSTWTHSALYIGRIHDIQDQQVRDAIMRHYPCQPHEQLIIEALLGEGTIIAPLSKYQGYHLRICRPNSLSGQDMQQVTKFAVQHLGLDYDLRQLLDLARFLFPWNILPRRWRSSLFEHNAGEPTRSVCSTMIATAFSSVHFPVAPVIQKDANGELRFYKRNTRLMTPSDFDYSPYFDIIKYPLIGLNDVGIYRQLPWNHDGVVCNAENDCYIPQATPPKPVRNVWWHRRKQALQPLKEGVVETELPEQPRTPRHNR